MKRLIRWLARPAPRPVRRYDAALVCTLLAILGCGVPRAGACGLGGPFGCAAASHEIRSRGALATVSPQADVVSIGSALGGRTIPPGFLGLSLEYNTVPTYEGNGANAVNPVLGRLIRNLAPGQTPIVRIGGDSTDWTWWPVAGMRPPPGVTTALSPSWVASARALVLSAGARLILGINLEANNTTIASVEARQLLSGIGRQHVEALEVGNEPQLYPIRSWYRSHTGRPMYGRSPTYDLAGYTNEFNRFERVLPHVPLAGPSVGHSWLPQLGQFITRAPRTGLVTFHAYGVNRYFDPFRGRNCSTPASDVSHPTVATLLAPFAAQGLARHLAPYVALAHRRGLRFRIDELNAITCAGTPGVSDTFASALWALEGLFEMAQAGVDGVNFHTWRGSAGRLFDFDQVQGHWVGAVRPEYFGLLMFAHAVAPGSRLLATRPTNGGQVRSWALQAPDRIIRVVLINDSLRILRVVKVRGPATAGHAQLQRLGAPSAYATTGVTLGGQSFDPQTTTGVLPGPIRSTAVTRSAGAYTVRLPAASATLLTIPRPRS